MVDLEGLAKGGSVEASLLKRIDPEKLPRHVAVIMDGNGRWAGERNLPRAAGHRAGIGSVREIVEISAQLGLQVLTLYAFSVENWKRPRSEIRKTFTRTRSASRPSEGSRSSSRRYNASWNAPFAKLATTLA